MDISVRLALVVFVISIKVAYHPTEAWYKQVGPNYYSVGRASGLLSGFRRSPYTRRAEPESFDSAESSVNSVLSDPNSRQIQLLKTMPICITEITPNLQSCEPQDGVGFFQCQADVLLSLDSADCVGA